MEFDREKLQHYLVNSYHYTVNEAEQLLNTAARMKPEARKLLADWSDGKGGLEKQ